MQQKKMFTKKLMRKNYLFRRRRRHDKQTSKHRIKMMDKDDQKKLKIEKMFEVSLISEKEMTKKMI